MTTDTRPKYAYLVTHTRFDGVRTMLVIATSYAGALDAFRRFCCDTPDWERRLVSISRHHAEPARE